LETTQKARYAVVILVGETCRAAIRTTKNNILTDVGEIHAEDGRQMEVPQDYLQLWVRLLTVLNL